LLWYALVVHTEDMSKPVKSSFSQYVVHGHPVVAGVDILTDRLYIKMHRYDLLAFDQNIHPSQTMHDALLKNSIKYSVNTIIRKALCFFQLTHQI